MTFRYFHHFCLAISLNRFLSALLLVLPVMSLNLQVGARCEGSDPTEIDTELELTDAAVPGVPGSRRQMQRIVRSKRFGSSSLRNARKYERGQRFRQPSFGQLSLGGRCSPLIC